MSIGVHVVRDRLKLADAGRTHADFTLDDVVDVTTVRFGSALYAGEEPFFAVSTPGQLLVVPLFAVGARELLLAVSSAHRDCVTFHEAECDTLPIGWRRRILGFLPLFPVPRLAVFHEPIKRPWRDVRPSTAADLQSLLGVTAHG